MRTIWKTSYLLRTVDFYSALEDTHVLEFPTVMFVLTRCLPAVNNNNFMTLIQFTEFHGNLYSVNLAFPTWDIFSCPSWTIQPMFDDVLYGMYMSSNQTESSQMRLPVIHCWCLHASSCNFNSGNVQSLNFQLRFIITDIAFILSKSDLYSLHVREPEKETVFPHFVSTAYVWVT